MKSRYLSILWIIIILFPLQSPAQTDNEIENLLNRAENRSGDRDLQEDLDLYLEVLDLDSTNYEALWNAGIINVRMGYGVEGEKKKIEHYKRGVELAERAIESHPDKGHGYYVLAAARGRWSDLQDKEARIEASQVIKENIEKAADLIPDYAPVWHLYGVFHSDVANISDAGRLVSGLVSEGVPEGSNEKAEEYLEKAIEMIPESILFRLDLARHYLKVDEQQRAAEILEKISEMEARMPNEERHKKKAAELLRELK